MWVEDALRQLGWVLAEKKLGGGGGLKLAFWVFAVGGGACGIGRAGGRGWAGW